MRFIPAGSALKQHSGLAGSADSSIDQFLQSRVVAPLPVQLATYRALPEPLVVRAGARLEAVLYRSFRHTVEQAVAIHAAGKGAGGPRQVATPDHMSELIEWLVLKDVTTMTHRAPHQQTPVTAQHDAMVGVGESHQFCVADVVLVQGVESQQPKIARQAAELGIGEESWLAQWRGIWDARSR